MIKLLHFLSSPKVATALEFTCSTTCQEESTALTSEKVCAVISGNIKVDGGYSI